MNDRWKKDYYRMTGEKYKNGIKSFVTMRMSHQIEYMKLWRKVSEKGNIVDKIRMQRKAKGLSDNRRKSIRRYKFYNSRKHPCG